MIDYYLKFKDESEANEALDGLEASIDVIGEIPEVTGWHVNVRCAEEHEWLDAHKIDPEPVTPIRVWC